MCAFFPSRDSSGSIIRPMPKIKKMLSDPQLLYQLVQLLLTYEPSIVYRNCNARARGYARFALHFAPLSFRRLFLLTHVQRLQHSAARTSSPLHASKAGVPLDAGESLLIEGASRSKKKQTIMQAGSEVRAHSVLSPLLPEANVFYLEEYGPEKYAGR